MAWDSFEEPIVCYGEDSGMMFSRRCANCGRFLKMPEVMEFKQNMMEDMKDFTKIECSKCGEVEPIFIGFL